MSSAFFRTLARTAAAGYPGRDRFARHFAYGKLAGDPVFEHVLRAGLVPDGARVLDLGCGQALLLAALLAARASHARGEWPGDWAPPPAVSRYAGVELRALDVERARAMAGNWGPVQGPHSRAHEATNGDAAAAEIVTGDIRSAAFPKADVVAVLDVLHYVDHEAQSGVLRRIRESLSPRGTLLLRVGDESGSLRFRYTVLVDRLSMRLRGHRLPRLWCRPAAAWKCELERLGFRVRVEPMSAGTPFANVLLLASYDGPP